MALGLYFFWAATTALWVWLALAPVPEQAPVWLTQTREVCFGTLSNGLPDTHGWISLAAPIPMLLALLVLMGRELHSQLKHLCTSVLGFLVLVALLMLPCGTVGYAVVRVAEAPDASLPVKAQPLAPDYPALKVVCPIFQLQDQAGAKVGPSVLKGEITLLTFAYAHCQTVCPGLLENLRQAAERTSCRVVVITLDPRRDTCGSLGGLGRYWKLPTGSFVLGGEVEQVERAIGAFQVPIERNLSTGEITHPALVFVLDGEAQIRYRFSNPSISWLETAVSRIRSWR